jgi:hypothetical protein
VEVRVQRSWMRSSRNFAFDLKVRVFIAEGSDTRATERANLAFLMAEDAEGAVDGAIRTGLPLWLVSVFTSSAEWFYEQKWCVVLMRTTQKIIDGVLQSTVVFQSDKTR